MLLPFVALVRQPNQPLTLFPAAAETAEQAALVVGQMCVQAGNGDAVILDVLSQQDCRALVSLFEQAQAAIDANSASVSARASG